MNQGSKPEAQRLLSEIDKYLAACPTCGKTRMAESWLAQKACKNGHLITRLRAGGGVHSDTAERMRAFMRTHK